MWALSVEAAIFWTCCGRSIWTIKNAQTGHHISREPPNASRMAARGVAMGEEEAADADPERLCQGISPGVAACTYPATVCCTSCKKWFCDAHAEDEQWHPCMLSDQ